MTLIKLTGYQADPGIEPTPVWVNPARIQYIRPYGGDRSLTEIRLGGTSVFVLETVETVLGLVGVEQ